MKHKKSGGPMVKCAIILATFMAAAASVHAAPITTLYNTGVSDTGALLAEGEIDPHYTLIFSSDPAFPGPEAYTLLPGFPVGPWLPEGPLSRWIAPQANQGTGNEAGSYTFSTTFDLGELDPSTAQITGQVTADNGVTAVRLNGSDLLIAAPAGFTSWTAFTIPEGSPFQPGVNTLEFDVSNGGLDPIGLRVEMTGRAVAPDEVPSIIASPVDQEVLIGETVTFTVDAEGAPPLSYQWLFEGEAIENATEATLTLTDAQLDDSGDYSVTVSNSQGDVTSDAATLTVLNPFPGIYNTGVDDNRLVLEEGMVDTHYKLIVNAQDPLTQDAQVQDSYIPGAWIPTSTESKWIGPSFDTIAGAGGDYVYELTLDLTGYDPATAYLAGNWASDNGGTLFLNGADTGFTSPGFGSYSSFALTSGFITGINRLEFRVRNEGAGFTGLRVENLRGTADEGTTTDLPPRIASQPQSQTRVITDNVSFTVVADGLQPFTYQWLKDGTEIPDATSATLTISPVLGDSKGSYTVRVTNLLGSTNSEPAVLTVVEPLIGVFNTGVDANGAPLPLGEPDPHYVLMESGDSAFPPFTSYAASGAPIPPWVLNDEDSQWITVRPSATEAAPGNYRYRLIFNINEDEVGTAAITAGVATDDTGTVFLNGTQITFTSGGFGGLTELLIPEGSGFVAGLNYLDFVIANGGAAANPTGLRVDNIVITGVTVVVTPTISVSQTETDLRISWPVSAEGFTLQETESLPGGWTDSEAAVVVEGTENVATIPIGAGARFYRLVQ